MYAWFISQAHRDELGNFSTSLGLSLSLGREKKKQNGHVAWNSPLFTFSGRLQRARAIATRVARSGKLPCMSRARSLYTRAPLMFGCFPVLSRQGNLFLSPRLLSSIIISVSTSSAHSRDGMGMGMGIGEDFHGPGVSHVPGTPGAPQLGKTRPRALVFPRVCRAFTRFFFTFRSLLRGKF
ncbi:hypothetical protein FIM1_4696 [Kluyveromyces marxianus]|uniref:Uncharacterized protein n=1 Tax=Kluyveromyces marxianus TaxID=4911 RepID=A0ABX6F2W9_KLUMA|nr:hypothetical protein FIM1_4696 [Kluyveromyces marxianus]